MYFAQQEVVFLQPGSNLLGSCLQPLLGFAGRRGHTGPTDVLPAGSLVACPSPATAPRAAHPPFQRNARCAVSCSGPNPSSVRWPESFRRPTTAGSPGQYPSFLPPGMPSQSLLAELVGTPPRSTATGGWVNDPEKVGES